MRKAIKNITLGTLALATFALTGCMSSGSSVGPQDETGMVILTTKTANVDRLSKPGLGKASVIELDSLYVTAVSDVGDTVRVELGVGDSGFTSSSTTDQNISIVLNLKALRSWTISARTVDVNDSIIQTGSVTVEDLKAGQVAQRTLNATPLFTMYTAKFVFTDSIYSPTGVTGQNINITKVEMYVDEQLVDDSTDAFEDSTEYILSYDYVNADADSVTLKVYGNLEGATTPWNTGDNLLYSKTVAISELNAVYPAPNTVNLIWNGPVAGVADLTVAIQKVGQVNLRGVTPDVVLD